MNRINRMHAIPLFRDDDNDDDDEDDDDDDGVGPSRDKLE